MKTVLIVDDTKNIRTLLTTCLEINGYNTLTAKNGEEALEFFKAKTIDLVFLDIKMPELSGTEVLRRIRNMGITIPVVIMTAFATVKNAVECTKLGAVAYLQKPFTADKVSSLLTELENSPTEPNNEIDIKASINLAIDLIEQNDLRSALETLKLLEKLL